MIFLLTKGEDGLETLIDRRQVKKTAHFREQARTWGGVVAAARELAQANHPHRAFVIDTINGAQQMLTREVIAKDFGGDEKKAAAFGGGDCARIMVNKWWELLDALDQLRERGMSVLLLSHAEVVKTPNPEGVDFDRWSPALERKHIWPELARWGDIVLFGHVEVVAEKETKVSRGKATGGTRHVLLSEQRAWHDAKNRHGLAYKIECGTSPALAWSAFEYASKGGKESSLLAE